MSSSLTLSDARLHAEQTVKRSGTSFGAGMRILSGDRRAAMYAVYAFCREVDDIADAHDLSGAEKRAGLNEWRDEIERVYNGRATLPTGLALSEHIVRYDLPREEFLMVIEGMEIDAAGPVVAPSMERLLYYTRRAAGAVGMLSMPIFGAPRTKTAETFALALGDALQLTNILRDVEEDAADGRIYMPREMLAAHDCPQSPAEIVDAPGLPLARADLATLAQEKFAAARSSLADLDWKLLRPALLMMGVYETTLQKMVARGWRNGQEKLSLSKAEKLAIAARWFFAPKLK